MNRSWATGCAVRSRRWHQEEFGQQFRHDRLIGHCSWCWRVIFLHARTLGLRAAPARTDLEQTNAEFLLHNYHCQLGLDAKRQESGLERLDFLVHEHLELRVADSVTEHINGRRIVAILVLVRVERHSHHFLSLFNNFSLRSLESDERVECCVMRMVVSGGESDTRARVRIRLIAIEVLIGRANSLLVFDIHTDDHASIATNKRFWKERADRDSPRLVAEFRHDLNNCVAQNGAESLVILESFRVEALSHDSMYINTHPSCRRRWIRHREDSRRR